VLGDAMGWSKTALSGAAALQQMEAALLGPVLGWLLDRYGPRRFVRAGVVLFGAGMIAMSRVETLVGFYACFVVVALGTSLAGFFPLNVAIIHWFEKRRARAISALSFGLALGGILVPAVAASLEAFGWRHTALASGVIAIALGLPLALVFRDRPEEVGEVIDGRRSPAASAGAEAAAAPEDGTRDFTAREALRTRAFWLLSLGHAFALFTVYAVIVHSIAHLKQSMGYSLSAAALVFTLVTVSQLGGIALGWLIGDRLDKRLICAGCMLAHASGLLLLAFAQSAAMVAAFAVLHGVAWGLRGPFMQAIRADYFGRSAIGMILGLSFMVVLLGQLGGPMIPGMLADITGGYRAGFTALGLLAGLGSLFFLLARRPARPLRAA
jgi:sugar phosphate permease